FHLLTTLQKLNAFPPFSPFFKFPNKFSLLFFDRKQLTSSDLQSIPLPHMAPYVADHDHDQDQAQTVCVMDASGNLGSALVESLLLRGYSVHAAVQLHGKLEGSFSSNSSSRLRVFEMDMFDYHAITEALRGCSALFYSFEPPSDHPDYDESMAEVEVMAAHNALEACAQTPTVHKVVFTSSATAVIWKEDRSSSSSSAAAELWHALSKTLSEKAAWALAMDRDINMVAVNGGLLLPSDHHHNHLSLSHPYLKGAAEMYDDGVLVTVDLDFLVEAHIRVFEDSSSFGRRRFSSSPPAGEVAEEREVEQRISNRKLCEHMVGFENGLKVH
ncbi:Cinnamoyl-CoA reductase-like SNL6, partial [Linum perenne]